MRMLTLSSLVVLSVLTTCAMYAGSNHSKKEDEMTIKMSSTAFKEGEMIPRKYTCTGEDISPPLKFENIPEGTRSLVLICEDPDAPVGIWVHWVLFDLPPDTSTLPEKIPAEKKLENGAVHGINDFKKVGYGGPCPPSGTHRYFFKVSALDRKLELKPLSTQKEVVEAMKGYVLAEGQLMGRFQR